MRELRILSAEAVGTFILMMGGPGTAVLAAGTGALDGAAVLAVALGFGLALLIAAYAIGPISGCHINPAVTVAMVTMRKIEPARLPAYFGGQLIGAALGGLTILILRNGMVGDFSAEPETFATNLWGEQYGYATLGAVALAEILLTAVLVVVVLSTTTPRFPVAASGLAVGLTLTMIHLISIPIDNTSVNPARSFGMAIFAGGDAIEQLWAFILFPVLGALLGVLVHLMLHDDALEDTLLDDPSLIVARDRALGLSDRLESGLHRAGDALDPASAAEHGHDRAPD